MKMPHTTHGMPRGKNDTHMEPTTEIGNHDDPGPRADWLRHLVCSLPPSSCARHVAPSGKARAKMSKASGHLSIIVEPEDLSDVVDVKYGLVVGPRATLEVTSKAGRRV